MAELDRGQTAVTRRSHGLNRLWLKEPSMLVIDSQIHIWQNALPPNPYHRQISSYSYDDALREMNEAGVDAALIHPPAPLWDPQVNELAYLTTRKRLWKIQRPDRIQLITSDLRLTELSQCWPVCSLMYSRR